MIGGRYPSRAKTGAEAPGTSGSQFFIVTPADAQLPPDYAIVGKVVDGLDVVLELEKVGTPGAGVPKQKVFMESVTITES